MKLTQQQLEAHLWGAANILRGKTAGQDYKNYILSLMFYKRLCDQWHHEADDAIAAQEKQQGRTFTQEEKAIFRARGKHRFTIPEGAHLGDMKAASTNLGEVLTTAMRAVSNANDELRGVFTVDWNQPAPDGSGKPLIPNEVVHALITHFDEHYLSNQSVSPDILGRAYEYLIKQFADDAGAKAGEFFTPPEGSIRWCGFWSRMRATPSMTPLYAVLAWNHPIVHNQIVRRAKTSNGTLKINTRDMKQIILPVPPKAEQNDLVALVAAVEGKADALKAKLTALEQLKKSLMHDLLTGRVRVPFSL